MSQRQALSTDQVSGPKPSQQTPPQDRVKFLELRKESEMKEGEKRKSALKDSASAVPRGKSFSPDRMVRSSSPEALQTAAKRSTTPEKIPEDRKGDKSKGKGQLNKGAKGKSSAGKGKGQPWRWKKRQPKGKGAK